MDDIVKKPKIATAALCGCFGCHMSFLDIDERILQLVELVETGVLAMYQRVAPVAGAVFFLRRGNGPDHLVHALPRY